MKTYLKCLLWAVLAFSMSVSIAMGGANSSAPSGEICFAKGNALYLTNLATKTPKLISPKIKGRGQFITIQWMDRNKLLFLYGTPVSDTRVGILDIRTKSIRWIPKLAGSCAIGFDPQTNKIDHITTGKPYAYEREWPTAYLAEYDPITRVRSKPVPLYHVSDDIEARVIRRWPKASQRFVPTGPSDVSDTIAIYDIANKKEVTEKWISYSDRERIMGQRYASISDAGAAPGGLLAAHIFTEQESRLCVFALREGVSPRLLMNIRVSNCRRPSISIDGKWIVWDTEQYHGSPNPAIWICPVQMNGQPIKVTGGYAAAWRP